MSEQRKAIIISTGMDNLELLGKLKQSEILTGESLERIGQMYAKLAAKKAAIETAENDASLARLARNTAKKEALYRAELEQRAAMSAIASGSGGVGSGFKTAEHIAIEGGAAATAGYAGARAAGAGAAAKTAEAGIDSVARRELMVMSRELASGNFKRFFSSFSIFLQHLKGEVPTLLKFFGTVARVVGPISDAATIDYAVYQHSKMVEAHMEESRTRFGTRLQTASLGAANQDRIDALERAGLLSPGAAERLRTMTGEGGTSDQLRIAQRFLMDKEAVAAERKAAAEDLAARAAEAAARAAADKAENEKKAAEKLKESTELNRKLTHLDRERNQIYRDAEKVGVTAPTLEQLAGRGYMGRLNAYFGEGGALDLSAGNGPYAKAAQDALYFKNKVTYDLANGLGGVAADGNFYGLAKEDRQRARAAENLLANAGLDTPAMKFEAMKEHLKDINEAITSLIDQADGSGIPVKIPSK